MATMHYLFISIFSVAVLIALGFGDRALRPQGREYNQPGMRYSFMEEAPAVAGGALADIRKRIIHIAAQEIGVREASGQNDGPRVEGYLAYTGLGKGYAWCAAFVSWCYGQVGLSTPRNPWAPALFPKARTYSVERIAPACDGRYSDRLSAVVKLRGDKVIELRNSTGKSNSRTNNLKVASVDITSDLFGIYSISA